MDSSDGQGGHNKACVRCYRSHEKMLLPRLPALAMPIMKEGVGYNPC